MSRQPCPVCGDPNAFPFWLDEVPPPTCPYDPMWPRKTVKTVCLYQRQKAENEAARRRITPDAFDEHGNVIPSEANRAIVNWINYVRGGQ